MVNNPVGFIGQSILGSTSGSVLFIDSNGGLAQDNTHFNYNPSLRYLGVGGTPTARLHILGSTASQIGRFDVGIDFTSVAVPPAPTLTLINSAGNINPGTHYYFVTYVTPIGETSLSVPSYSAPQITTDASNAQVQVTIPVSSDYRVTARKVYRAVTNATQWYDNVRCVGTINDNTTTTFIDNVADASRTGTGSAVRENTTSKFITINGTSTMFFGNSTLVGINAGATLSAGTASGGDYTFIGRNAGQSITTGTKNTAIGYNALLYSTTTTSAVAIGDSAASQCTDFSYGIAIGRNSAAFLTAGYDNIFVGSGAGFGATYYTGGANIAIGSSALLRATTGITGNLVIGLQSGQYITTGSYNTVLGLRAANALTTGSCNIILGAYVDAPSATTSGQLNIGNVIYGKNLYQTLTTSSTPVTTGMIGVGINPTGVGRFELAAGTASYVPLKLTEGVNKTTPVSGGIEYDGTRLYVTDNNAVRQTLVQAAYGSLYENNDTGSTITTTTAGTYYGWVTATAGGNNLTTLDTANATADRITVDTGGGGVFFVAFSASFYNANNNVQTHIAVFKNGVIAPNLVGETTPVNANYEQNVPGNGILTLAAGDYIDLRITTNNNGEVVTLKHVSLTLHRISR